ncbi:hypothetical protein B0H19DRAFT_1138173 [Mycena capillaripes]|nr:hypothetical protein B0H19DRAFT_1138173 [Mycena capillaripes]
MISLALVVATIPQPTISLALVAATIPLPMTSPASGNRGSDHAPYDWRNAELSTFRHACKHRC